MNSYLFDHFVGVHLIDFGVMGGYSVVQGIDGRLGDAAVDVF